MLPYTICFCRRGDRILMLYRNKPPYQQLWNGLGGKLKMHETALACIQREILEEADIDLQMIQRLHFAGIVTWAAGANKTDSSKGMYAFIADLPQEWPIWEGERQTAEGLLCWKPIEWICNPQNSAVVDNIPHFLPKMLAQTTPWEYYCDYRGDKFVELIIRPLPQDLTLLENTGSLEVV
jgi:8-oxo-dGTP diphosphatase